MKKIDKEKVRKSLPHRDDSFHKGNLGKALIIAGSDRYVTTGIIVAKATMRAGAGLVTLATSENARKLASSRLMEEMIISYEDEKLLDEVISKSDAIAIGCGLDRQQRAEKLVGKIISLDKKIIVDADGLFHLKKFLKILSGGDILITPHEGEFSYLFDVDVEKIRANRQGYAEEFASKYGIKVLLKGKNTIITDGRESYYLDKGSYKMATGGMGDCLTGIILAIGASGASLFDSAITGAYIHSLTADILAKNMYTVLARDVIEKIPYVLNEIKEKQIIKY